MGFFGRGNQNNQNKITPTQAGQVPPEWDMSGVRRGETVFFDTFQTPEAGRGVQPGQAYQAEQSYEQEKRLEAERWQRKIVAALYDGGGKVNGTMMAMQDVMLPQGAEARVQRMFRDGEIGEEQERALLTAVEDPMKHSSSWEVWNSIHQNRQEMRILGYMTQGVDGFNNPSEVEHLEIRRFLQKFPLPMDFEKASGDFLEMIERKNGAVKLAEYEKSMGDFKLWMYGERQKCWDQLKEMRDGALGVGQAGEADTTRMLDGTQWGEAMGTQRGEAVDAQVMAARGQKVMRGAMINWDQFFAGGQASGAMVGAQATPTELERSAESLYRPVGHVQVSKAQVAHDLVNRGSIWEGLWADDACEDSALVQMDKQVYGVFDGAGGVGGAGSGREASQLAMRKVEELSNQYGDGIQSGGNLAWVLNEAGKAVKRNARAGGVTTGVLTKVVERADGGKSLAWAAVGDSRIYIVRGGQAYQMTNDEGEGNKIWNALGVRDEDCVKQYGDVPLYPGDRVVLCSDGVTGDYGSELMSPEEVAWLVGQGRDAAEAAINLAGDARKRDDRTAVVFEI